MATIMTYNDYLNTLGLYGLRKEARKQHRMNMILTIIAVSMTSFVVLGVVFITLFPVK